MRNVLFLLLVVSCTAAAQKMVSGRVTYLASGSVYLSIGRDQRIEDSTRAVIVRATDTVAVLQVFAVSSKTSVCSIRERRKEIHIGDSVLATVAAEQVMVQIPASKFDSSATVQKDTSAGTTHVSSRPAVKKRLSIRGRIGVQYNAMLFDDPSLTMQQPGLVVSLRGNMAEVPLKFDMYGTFRLSGRNGASPFSSQAKNDSRVYRFSVEYDDQENIIGAGRILPLYASAIGYVDGVSVARRMGKFVAGMSLGFQPDPSLQLPTTNTKKFVLFSQYQSNDEWNTTGGIAYGRIWSQSGIEREAVSTSLSFYTLSGFSGYASSDVDLRTLSDGENKIDPALSLLVCSVNYRFSNMISAGFGVDASRPVYSLSSNTTIPDSLLDKRLRSGASVNISLSLTHGAGLYNVYTMRFGESGFGQEYSNTSSIYYTNVAGSGAVLRLNYLINQSSYAMMHGIGMNVQRNFFGVDCGVRFQQNRSDIQLLQTTMTSKTYGFDMSALITSQLSLIGSMDVMSGWGTTSTSFFLELSRRF